MMLKGIHKTDRLRLNICSKNVYFEVYMDGSGSTFKISKDELRRLIK